MNASEFGFLAVGLILGVATGAALIVVLRARPPVPREVRVTVAPDAVPRRRGTTLAEDAFALAVPEPARIGPADHGMGDLPSSPHSAENRTVVQSARSPLDTTLKPSYRTSTAAAAMVGYRVEPGRDPVFLAMQQGPAASVTPALTAVALLDREEDAMQASASGAQSASGILDAPAPLDPANPCGGSRQIATERCELAVRARAGVGVADETMRAAQRAYDLHTSRAEAMAATTDPRTVRLEKETAQAAFRDARGRAGSPASVETAARDWLSEINRINMVVRDAGAQTLKEREAASAIAPTLERLALEADAARIKAEAAEAACLAARQAVADCVEALVANPPIAPVHTPFDQPGPRSFEPLEDPLTGALGAGQTPVIFLLLRGDGAAMERTCARLSGDPAEQRQWRASLAELVDAITAVSVSQSALDFPTEHPFWGPFTLEQDRDIVAALSSLGFRFDGRGGWQEDRIPTQRDLSMALGYAGLDPMRIRQWPTEAEMRNLFADVTVAAGEHLAGAAGDLTLGELVAMLGRRADGLAMLWNDWGRVRPLLLEEA